MSHSWFMNPAIGSAAGWPIVLYFHQVVPHPSHYTQIAPDDLVRGIEVVLHGIPHVVDPRDLSINFRPPAEPSILFTFDDGHRSFMDAAKDILDRYNIHAVLFCITDRLTSATVDPVDHQEWMTWPDVVAMQSLGHVIGSHTKSHLRLSNMSDRLARDEVKSASRELLANTGARPKLFAYPYGGIPAGRLLSNRVLGFGTVRSAPSPWTIARHAIRRTYLPSRHPEDWCDLVENWRRQWYRSP